LQTSTGATFWKCLNRLQIALGLGVLGVTPAAAQQGQTNMVGMKGACTKFVVGGQNYGCKGVVYMALPNGRITFSIGMPNGALTLSGSKDSQLDPTRYVLEIDTIRAGRGDGRSDGYKAKGRCTMRLSADGSYAHSLSCSATNGIEAVAVEFKGDGSKVDRKSF